MEIKANIHEIFFSIQGEGVACGLPFLFVRFTGCNLSCEYCDTPESREPATSLKIYTSPADTNRVFQKIPNPVKSELFGGIIGEFQFKYITFTGGEPLLNREFIESVLDTLDAKYILLETNGTLYEGITPRLIERIDRWAVDIKLPSSSGYDHFKENRAFLEKLTSARGITVKTIFDPTTPEEELRIAQEMAESLYHKNPETVLVFQPVTSNNRIMLGENVKIIYKIMQESAMEVRLIPQAHKVLDIP